MNGYIVQERLEQEETGADILQQWYELPQFPCFAIFNFYSNEGGTR